MKLPQEGCSIETRNKYYEFIDNIHGAIQNFESETTIKLSTKAKAKYRTWQMENIIPVLNDENEKDIIKATISKLEAVVLRIALILECADQLSRKLEPSELNIAAIEAAIEITDYFRLNFLDVIREVTEEEIINYKEYHCLKDYAQNTINSNSIDKQAQIANLLHGGHSNATINKALGVPRRSITNYSTSK